MSRTINRGDPVSLTTKLAPEVVGFFSPSLLISPSRATPKPLRMPQRESCNLSKPPFLAAWHVTD